MPGTSDFDIVSKDEEIDTCYGLETFYITKEEITALLSGKKLYSTVNAGEYAITIEIVENDCLCEFCCNKDYCLTYQDYKNSDGIIADPITACGRYKKLYSTVNDKEE